MQSTIIRSPADYQWAVQTLVTLKAEGRSAADAAVQSVTEAIEHYESVTRMWDKKTERVQNKIRVFSLDFSSSTSFDI